MLPEVRAMIAELSIRVAAAVHRPSLERLLLVNMQEPVRGSKIPLARDQAEANKVVGGLEDPESIGVRERCGLLLELIELPVEQLHEVSKKPKIEIEGCSAAADQEHALPFAAKRLKAQRRAQQSGASP